MQRLRFPPALAGVRARVLLMLGLAAVPLVAMAAWAAWQNGSMVAARATERVGMLRAAALARHQLLLADLAEVLDLLARRGALLRESPEQCDAALREIPGLASGRYANAGLLDSSGALRCSAAPLPPGSRGLSMANSDWYASARQSGHMAVGHLAVGPITGKPVLIAGRPLADGNGMAVVGLSVNWLAGSPTGGSAAQDAVWLVDNAGGVIPVAGAPASALPAAGALAKMLAGGAASESRAVGGVPFAYAVANLPEGLRLLVGTPAAKDRADAQRVVLQRFLELALLLGAGFAAVAWGADLALVGPIRRLAQSVAHWHGGGTFNPVIAEDMPQELRELSLSFSRATQALAEHDQQLRGALEQQDLLMQEIHHRVKNNLQIIASLLNLQASRIRQPEARAEFQAARDRIRALATLHRHLYAEGELHAINMRSFLNELCGQLLQAVGDRNRISLTIEAPELRISSDQAVPLALIVTEAVSNSAKYAFPGGRQGHIAVRLTMGEGDTGRLVIEDDGVGIPAGRGETETGVRDGIGLQLIRGFARQLGATLSITEDHGTRYQLDLTLRRTRLEAEEEESAETPAEEPLTHTLR